MGFLVRLEVNLTGFQIGLGFDALRDRLLPTLNLKQRNTLCHGLNPKAIVSNVEHDEGEKEGAKADLVGGALYDVLFSHIDPIHSDEWKAGWENGRNNRSKD